MILAFSANSFAISLPYNTDYALRLLLT